LATNQIVFPFSIGGDIIDLNTDLLKVEIPDPTNATVVKVRVSSMSNATGSATIQVRNASGGGGDTITVTIGVGTREDVTSGASMTVTDYLWIRSGTPNGLSNISVTIYVTYT
jgi:hypothetical protein